MYTSIYLYTPNFARSRRNISPPPSCLPPRRFWLCACAPRALFAVCLARLVFCVRHLFLSPSTPPHPSPPSSLSIYPPLVHRERFLHFVVIPLALKSRGTQQRKKKEKTCAHERRIASCEKIALVDLVKSLQRLPSSPFLVVGWFLFFLPWGQWGWLLLQIFALF